MSMNALTAYVQEELRRLEREYQPKGAHHREQWFLEQQQVRASSRRVVARWAGDRLVRIGEWLRAWSMSANSDRPLGPSHPGVGR